MCDLCKSFEATTQSLANKLRAKLLHDLNKEYANKAPIRLYNKHLLVPSDITIANAYNILVDAYGYCDYIAKPWGKLH